MNEEPSSPNDKPWLARITQAFSTEPRNRSELVSQLRAVEKNGVLESDALSIIEGALQVSEMKVRDIMVPRSQVITVKANDSIEDCLEDIIESAHSRFPVLGENADEVIGILLAKDLLPLTLNKSLDKFNLKEILRPATFVPESKRLNVLLKEFRAKRNHMAIVVDEYGGVAGVVTIEDVLEQIVGEIEDEHDIEEDSYIKPFNDNSYTVKALTPIEEFNEYFNTDFSDDEFDTIGGLVTKQFGHLPKRDEVIELGKFIVKIINADNRRIGLLHLTPQK